MPTAFRDRGQIGERTTWGQKLAPIGPLLEGQGGCTTAALLLEKLLQKVHTPSQCHNIFYSVCSVETPASTHLIQ